MPRTLPTVLPDDARLYLYAYGTSATPLATRLAEVALRSSVRFGPDEPTLVVSAAEFADYTAAQVDQETVYHVLPATHLGTGLVGVLIPAGF
jgi:hypothetical protein